MGIWQEIPIYSGFFLFFKTIIKLTITAKNPETITAITM